MANDLGKIIVMVLILGKVGPLDGVLGGAGVFSIQSRASD